MLHYEVNVVPKLFFPATFVENIIKEDLPKNVYAIAKCAEIDSAEGDSKVVGVLRMSKPSNALCLHHHQKMITSTKEILSQSRK